MRNLDSRFNIGSLLIALGCAFILGNTGAVNSIFWTFVGFFLLFDGVRYTAKYMQREDKSGTENYISMIFIGIFVLLFTFSIIQFSIVTVVAAGFISVGLALLIKGFFYKQHGRDITTGLILIAIGLFLFIPFVLNVSEIVFNAVNKYGIWILIIILGIIMFIPRKGGKSQ
ncbi:MAG: hypothetical protein J7J57_06445 [Caldisericaceae bacterium]|nr:hypothetical protein [Caldisericaceae bacterium]